MFNHNILNIIKIYDEKDQVLMKNEEVYLHIIYHVINCSSLL